MKPSHLLLALAAVCGSALAQSGGPSDNDPNAIPQGPGGTSAANPATDAQSAYETARAECRKEVKPQKRDCTRQAEKDYDREQRDKPQLNMNKPTTAGQ